MKRHAVPFDLDQSKEAKLSEQYTYNEVVTREQYNEVVRIALTEGLDIHASSRCDFFENYRETGEISESEFETYVDSDKHMLVVKCGKMIVGFIEFISYDTTFNYDNKEYNVYYLMDMCSFSNFLTRRKEAGKCVAVQGSVGKFILASTADFIKKKFATDNFVFLFTSTAEAVNFYKKNENTNQVRDAPYNTKKVLLYMIDYIVATENNPNFISNDGNFYYSIYPPLPHHLPPLPLQSEPPPLPQSSPQLLPQLTPPPLSPPPHLSPLSSEPPTFSLSRSSQGGGINYYHDKYVKNKKKYYAIF